MKFVSSHRLFTRVQNAVLFRAPWRVSNVDVQDLPPQGHTHPRGFVVARLRAHGTRLTAVAAHLGLVPIERFHHARLVADHLAGVDGALILGADVNEGPEGPTARWLSERMFDAAVQSGGDGGPTFPAWAPTARIDYVFVNQLAPIVRAWVPSGQATREASDHRPVLAEVELSAEGSL
jgi:endonuclease/exonuclease/phosphatase family metal-dependent hydrolase